MKMIIGLGNPGQKYRNTKHNIGFITLDEWAFQHKLAFNKNKFEALYLETTVQSEKTFFVKPLTFMNESGRAVKALMDYYHIAVEDIVVIYDDMDLPTGKIRLRQKGSAGGHNGIKSIVQHINTQEFNRIRIGVGRPEYQMTVIQHVLSPFSEENQAEVLYSVKESVSAIDYYLDNHTFQETMNRFN